MSAVIPPYLEHWAREHVRRIGTKVPGVPATRRRRLLIVHLDGVPRELLEEVLRSGRMPFLSRLVRTGAYHLDRAFWGSPASTPFFQAGLLYGLRHPNLPAYNWFDRELGRRVQMNTPRDALAIEERLGQRAGGSLLAGGGHTYFSLFQAEAGNRLCMSTLASFELMAQAFTHEMQGVLVARTQRPLAYLQALGREAWAAAREVVHWASSLRDWRHERTFLISRVLLQRLGWSFVHTKALVDMVRGVPVVYLVYGNYDEVAHRRGPRSVMALTELYRVDAHLAELYAVAQVVQPTYDVIFLTDHGHVDSAPLERRGRGQRLGEVLLEGPPLPLPEPVWRGLLAGRPWPVGGQQPPPVGAEVVEAGNFSHVYLEPGGRPLEARELVARYRGVLARAVHHPDIGLVALRRGDSAVAVVDGGVYGPEEVLGAPLAPGFSRHAVADFLRELPHMPNAGDLVLFGQALTRGGTVGFAWEFGSHGGLTRVETESLVCWPASAPVDLSGLSHCVQLHERLSEVYRE